MSILQNYEYQKHIKMKETKEEYIKKMLEKKADENNIIDLDAYTIGLEDMYDSFVSTIEMVNVENIADKYLGMSPESLKCENWYDMRTMFIKDVSTLSIVNRKLLLDFADYSENDKTSLTTDECVDNYIDQM